jgi:hypothetical protein
VGASCLSDDGGLINAGDFVNAVRSSTLTGYKRVGASINEVGKI